MYSSSKFLPQKHLPDRLKGKPVVSSTQPAAKSPTIQAVEDPPVAITITKALPTPPSEKKALVQASITLPSKTVEEVREVAKATTSVVHAIGDAIEDTAKAIKDEVTSLKNLVRSNPSYSSITIAQEHEDSRPDSTYKSRKTIQILKGKPRVIKSFDKGTNSGLFSSDPYQGTLSVPSCVSHVQVVLDMTVRLIDTIDWNIASPDVCKVVVSSDAGTSVEQVVPLPLSTIEGKVPSTTTVQLNRTLEIGSSGKDKVSFSVALVGLSPVVGSGIEVAIIGCYFEVRKVE